MELRISIDLDALPDDTAAAEVGRILRYWAGAMPQLDLDGPAEHELMDRDGAPVGTLVIH